MSEPTNLQLFVAELKKTGRSSYHGAYFQVPFRVQMHLHAKVEALTKHLGSTRNKVLNDLLSIALDQVYQSLDLDEDTLHEIQVEEDRILHELLENRKDIKSGDMADD